jgi:hypothetical protein
VSVGALLDGVATAEGCAFEANCTAFGRGRSDVLAHEAESVLDAPMSCPLPPNRYSGPAQHSGHAAK